MIGKFTKDTFSTFITRILATIFGLITSIIIARVLGPEGKGIYSLCILLPSLLVIFSNFGITSATVFYIGKKKYSPSEIFGNNIIFATLVSIFSILIGLVIIFFFSNRLFAGVERQYLLLSLSLIPFTFFFSFISQVLLGLQKIRNYNIVEVVQFSSFFLIVVILLIGFQLSIKATIVTYIFSFFLAGIVLFFLTKIETKSVSLKFNKKYFIDAFSFGFKVYLASIFSFLHYRVDMFLVNFFLNPIAVGFYSIAVGLGEGTLLFSHAVATTHFPRAASEINQKSLKEFTPLVCRSVLFVTLLVVALLFIFANKLIVLLYSEKFINSVSPFRVLLIGLLAVTGWRIVANDLTARGKPMLNTYLIGIFGGLNITLNIILIPKLEIVGAAWASTVSYSFMFMATVLIYGRISENRIEDVVIPQKSDIRVYKNILLSIISKLL